MMNPITRARTVILAIGEKTSSMYRGNKPGMMALA